MVTVPGWGLILGHGMCRLDPRPGRPNSVAPGKRPLNNVMTMVLRTPTRDIGLGMPGGRRIISVSAQLVHRLVEHDVGPAEAVATPRLHAAHHGLEVMADFPDDALQRLRQVGNQVTVMDRMGGGAMVAEVDRASGHTRAAGSAGRSAAAGS